MPYPMVHYSKLFSKRSKSLEELHKLVIETFVVAESFGHSTIRVENFTVTITRREDGSFHAYGTGTNNKEELIYENVNATDDGVAYFLFNNFAKRG